jgi:hypothetical protein
MDKGRLVRTPADPRSFYEPRDDALVLITFNE